MRQMTLLGTIASDFIDEGNGFSTCLIEIKNAKQVPLKIKLVFRKDLSTNIKDKIKLNNLILVNGIFDFDVNGSNLSFAIIVNDITFFNNNNDNSSINMNGNVN
ncbi:MAG: hypothetical protein LBR40_04390 [Bacilli bacterium]|jgi:hypothetical protein|nr:hypothetical protein [Bacilli bacterium]